MGNILPADAFEKASAKTKDFYPEMTDEERAAEDLPPRPGTASESPAAPATETAVAVETEAPAAPAKPAAPAPSPEAAASDAVLDEIASLREDLEAALGTPTADPEPEAESDPLLEQALEHEDPVIQGLGKRLQLAEKELQAQRDQIHEERTDRSLVRLDAEFDFVEKNYDVAGKPITKEHIGLVEDYMLANPDLARTLAVEQVVRAVFPDAVRRTAAAPPPRPAAPAKGAEGQPVATIVDVGATGGSPAAPWKPSANESIESAVTAAGRRLFPGVRR